MNYVLDIETTTDLKEIRLVGIYNASSDEYFSANSAADLHVWLGKLTNEDNVITWNGTRFDWDMLKELWSIELEDYLFHHVDSYIVAKMLFPDMRHSLMAQCKHWFPHKPELWKTEPWEEIGCTKEDFYNLSSLPVLDKYCEQDCRTTYMVHRMIAYAAKKIGGNWKHPLKVEQKVGEITNRQVKKRVKFNTHLAIDTQIKMFRRMKEIEEYLESELPVMPIPVSQIKWPPKKQFLKDGTPSLVMEKYCASQGFNCELYGASWAATRATSKAGKEIHILPLKEPLEKNKRITLSQQDLLKQWLLEQGWKPTMWNTKLDKATKRKVRSTPRLTDKMTKEPCPHLAHIGFHWIPLLSEWLMLRARAGVLMSSHDKGWIPEAQANGDTIASDADTVGTPTARYKHRGIVNVPRVTSAYGKEFRSMFEARDGKVWVGWDASSLEACMEAHYTYPYDSDYANTLVSGNSDLGTDVHTRNMIGMGLPNRDVAKTFKYAVTYGAQPPKLAESLNVTRKQAEIWFRDFWNSNPALLKLKKDLEKEWESYDKKYLVGLDGRLIATRSQHALLNTKFQGAGAVVMKHACLIADRRISDVPWTTEAPYGLIRYHDEEVWECVPYQAPKVLEIGIKSIEEAGIFLNLNVPITGAGKYGKNWADVH